MLKYNETVGRYCPMGARGRFPLPEDKGRTDRLGFVNGVIRNDLFSEDIYDKLLAKYEIS